ncbi:F-box protein CPR1-like isoform X1 [Quercus lobata]|uniref:F-box protein CPR1-like isoform X1 n=1 Tax=Quercus lobata TaxID=97700 RepID=UPI001248C7F9|nr:F-box protein CPR1-like isoform X1 [Quercus lobata]XP_030927839.1 F-box protein CPR1-like isoform X1 [Quercus lobata]
MSDNRTTNLIIPWGSLPDEILTNIFVFLPIKSIIICTSVSKAWKSLIKNPTFISTHLHHSLNKNQNLLFFRLRSQNQKEFYALHNEDDADFTQHARFDYPFHASDLVPHNKKCIVVGSCNGLLFLSNFFHAAPNNGFCLWNPCVGKLLKLPSPNVTYATHGAFRGSSGFGFDPKTKDYKVVSVVTLLENFDLEKTRPQVEIYTLSTGQWRMLRTGLAPICVLLQNGPQTFINGALHWVAFRDSDNYFHNFVLIFDLGDEVFHEILLPEFPGNTGLMSGSVSVYRNSIAFFRQDNDFLHMWAMKEYGVVSSWTKVLSLPSSSQRFFGSRDDIPRALGFRRNGEVILKVDGGRLISLDLETREIKDLRIIGCKKTIVDYYVESLVLLDKAANSEDTY